MRALRRFQVSLLLMLLAESIAFGQGLKFGPTAAYQDWMIGCDNGLRCVAQSMPEGTITIRRDAGPQSGVEISIRIDEADAKLPTDFIVDGEKIASVSPADGVAAVKGEAGLVLAGAIARGKSLEVKTGERVLATPSLAGSSAALRYVDAQQGRAGTTTALVAVGPTSAQGVRAAPPLPVVTQVVPAPSLKPAPLFGAERAAVLKLSGCEDAVEKDQVLDTFALSTTQTLILVPCGSGNPYNFNSVALIGNGSAARKFTLAKFESQPGPGVRGSGAILTNGGWNSETAVLTNQYKARGYGDCGDAQEYVWDGTMFRLIEASVMPDCRKSWDWFTIWRATPRRVTAR